MDGDEMSNIKETDLYKPVKEWLEERGYTVFPEIDFHGTRADVVGTKEGSIVIVELKTSLSLDLIHQGMRWKNKQSANEIYLAIPKRTKPISVEVLYMLDKYGLGLISVSEDGYKEHVQAKIGLINSRYDISKSITDLHGMQDIEGGHSGGGYLTGYKITMIRIRAFLETMPYWVSLDMIMKNCPTHYTGNARQSTGKALKEFEKEWCDCKIIRGKLHFKYKVG